jgi:glutathione synthase/RimK-type ligase-like ATP-grasp enzyme
MILLVTDNPKRFALDVPGVHVVAAREYLTDPGYSALRGAKVFNLCRAYRYQTAGYYVSLLGAARGHHPLPSIATIQDLRLQPVIRVASQDLEEHIHAALRHLRSRTFELSIYFGRNVARRYDRLSLALFNQFPAPFLRARLARREEGWELEGVRLIGANDIPESHRDFVRQQARRFFDRPHRAPARRRVRYDLAILHNPEESLPPSNERALRQFERAAEALGIEAQRIEKEEYGRIAEFDALFVRETTSVAHHTYRFARRATAEGLVVIDDPDSIVKCSNKVYLSELMARHRLATPRTVIVARETAELIRQRIGLPCVVKSPDSAFSRGVSKFEDEASLGAGLERLFESSDLLIAQEFVPTPFDWRVGVLDGSPLFVCRYHMARRHWQIVHRQGDRVLEGVVDTLAVESAPPRVVSLAVKAARLIGNGLYGVDLKEIRGRPLVIEINDNPNIDAGYEDRVLGHALYQRVMRTFFDRLEAMRQRGA